MHKHFTLKQFRYFLAVSESGSVAAAARMVNIAQSALTKDYGVYYFDRDGSVRDISSLDPGAVDEGRCREVGSLLVGPVPVVVQAARELALALKSP